MNFSSFFIFSLKSSKIMDIGYNWSSLTFCWQFVKSQLINNLKVSKKITWNLLPSSYLTLVLRGILKWIWSIVAYMLKIPFFEVDLKSSWPDILFYIYIFYNFSMFTSILQVLSFNRMKLRKKLSLKRIKKSFTFGHPSLS